MVSRSKTSRALFVLAGILLIAAGVTFTLSGCRVHRKTLRDWAYSPVSADLLEYDKVTGTLALVVHNNSYLPVFVDRLSMIQVCRASTMPFTQAYEASSDAKHPSWLIFPGGSRRYVFNFNTIRFKEMNGARSYVARRFIDEIPAEDRYFTVGVGYGDAEYMAYSTRPAQPKPTHGCSGREPLLYCIPSFTFSARGSRR